MNVTAISSPASLYPTQAVGGVSSATYPRSVEESARVQESTRVALSAYGLAKSATAQVEAAADRLRGAQKMSSAKEVRESAQVLADSLNQQQKAIENLGAGQPGILPPAAPTIAADARITLSSNEMRMAIQGSVTAQGAALQRIGLSSTSERILQVDSVQLQQSLAADPVGTQAVLAAVGQSVGEVARAQLAPTGPISAPISALTAQLAAQSGTLDAAMQHQNQMQLETTAQQQGALDQQVQQQQDLAQRAFAVNGTQVYSRVFSY